ncbi:MAG: ExbD/TolR family protein [Phycisphaerae bacterium]|jgi:biopolymer transport protein ExbD
MPNPKQPRTIRTTVLERYAESSSGLKFQITALTDIVFLLLIFFIATTRFRPSEGELPMGLPTTQVTGVGRALLIDPLRVELDTAEGAFVIRYGGKEVITESTSAAAMNDVAAEFIAYYDDQKRKPEDPLELSCGDELTWNHLAKFYNIMYGLGIENITFIVD